VALQELELPTNDGELRHFYGGRSDYIDGAGRVTGQWLMLSDVTEQKLREAQLFNLSKLASLGEMASGVAHEMNQPLHALRLAIYNVQRQVSKPEFATDVGAAQKKLAEKFARMDELVGRCDGLVRQMRTFGKAPSADLLSVHLQAVASEAMLLFTEQLRLKGIVLISNIDPDASVLCSPKQLEQVLINLIANARDAVADSPIKEIRLETHRQDDRWMLRVVDTGSGIDDAIKNRLFEPFFSTKEVNQGTGLGLSISFGMINEMGGVLSLENNSDVGATAVVSLPVAQSQ
jgi:histidine kinase